MAKDHFFRKHGSVEMYKASKCPPRPPLFRLSLSIRPSLHIYLKTLHKLCNWNKVEHDMANFPGIPFLKKKENQMMTVKKRNLSCAKANWAGLGNT